MGSLLGFLHADGESRRSEFSLVLNILSFF